MTTKSGLDIKNLIRGKLNSPNVCLLFGAGSSKSVGYPLMSELTQIAIDQAFGKSEVSIALKSLSGNTIEEQLEELFGQLRSPGLSQLNEKVLQDSVDHILDVIFDECSKPASLEFHRKFVRAVFNRIGDRKRIYTFTTNYDMLFEWACDSEMIYCVNGFFGVQCRMYDANQFDIRPARLITQTKKSGPSANLCPCFCLYKLHGSVSWISDGTIKEVPVEPGGKRQPGQLMVFPTPQKYSETWKTPYIDLFTRMRDILSTKQTVLVSHGFGFGDAHIKPMVEQCLKDNTFILVVISKTMLPSFDSLKNHPNVTIVTENLTIIGGKEIKIKTNLWEFSKFVDVFSQS